MGFRGKLTTLTAVVLTVLLLATPAFAVTLTADELYMLNLVNKERRANGLNALDIEPKLVLMARRYSQEMIEHDFFGHVSPVTGELINRVNASGVQDGWSLAGENLAGAPTVDSAFQGLMNSTSHRENMLEPVYTHVGIGAIDGGPYGKMFTQEFISYPKNTYRTSSDAKYDLLVSVDKKLRFFDPPAFIREGRVLIPLRKFFEDLGASVAWDSGNQRVTIDHPNVSIVLTVGENVAFVNNQPVLLDAVPVIKDINTFVPLRFVAESLGAKVDWNNDLRTVEVSTANQ